MNKTLAIYFDDEVVIGAIEPYKGKFSTLAKGNKEHFPLYFLITDNEIQYGSSYKQDFLKGENRVYGNFYELILQSGFGFQMLGYERDYISLLEPIIQDMLEIYQAKMTTFGADPQGFEEKIPISVAYSDNISLKAKQHISHYLTRHDFIHTEYSGKDGFAELFIRQLLAARALPDERLTYAVVEALNSDLNISMIQFSPAGEAQRVHSEQFSGYGADPRVGVLTRYVVDEINRSRHILHTDAEKEAEYRKHLHRANTWNERLLKTNKPYIHVKVALSAMPNSPSNITIRRKTIDELTRAHSQQLGRYFERCVQKVCALEEVSRIFIVGDTLKNSQVLRGFYRFGEEKLWVWGNEGIFECLKGQLVYSRKPDLEATSPTQATKASNPAHGSGSKKITTLSTSNLEPGEKISFSWNPNRKVVARYKGNQEFEIVQHTNSRVISGDTFVLEKISVGTPALLTNVIREGKVLGKYRSGAITGLEQING